MTAIQFHFVSSNLKQKKKRKRVKLNFFIIKKKRKSGKFDLPNPNERVEIRSERSVEKKYKCVMRTRGRSCSFLTWDLLEGGESKYRVQSVLNLKGGEEE